MQASPTLPLPGVSRATALDLVTGLSQMYANLQTQIAQHIAAELAKGITLPTWADQKLKAAGDMHRWTRTLLDRIGRDSSEEVSRTILEAYARGGDEAMHAIAHAQNTLPQWVDLAGINPGPKIREALTSRGKEMDRKLSELGQAFPGVAAMQRVAGALHLRINGTHMPILRWTDDAYRQVVAKAGLTDVLAGTQTQRQTAQKVWEQLVGDGITGFTDKAGRRWNLASYVDMATRTGVAHAAVEGHLDRLAGAGIDLVIVSNAPQECPRCRPWEGKILSRSGHGVTVAASAQIPEAAKATHIASSPQKIAEVKKAPAAPSFDDRLRAADKAGPSTEAAPLQRLDQIGKISGKLAGISVEEARDALYVYKGTGYAGINNALRESNGAEASSKHIPALDAVMNASRLTRDVATYRYIDDPALTFKGKWDGNADMAGLTWTDHAYVSTTSDETRARTMAGRRGVSMRILVPKGTSAAGMKRNAEIRDAEKELLLERGLKYRVVKDHGVSAEGRRVLDVEVVPQIDLAAAPANVATKTAVKRPQGLVRETLAKATTKKELRDAIEAELKRLLPGRAGGGPRFSSAFSAGDLDTAREHAEGILRGVEKFPQVPAHIVSVEQPPEAVGNAFAWAGRRQLTFNVNLTTKAGREKYLKHLDASVDGWDTEVLEFGEMVPGSGFHPRNTNTPVAVAIHEFGHLVDIHGLGHRIQGQVEALLVKESERTGNRVSWLVEKTISKYALANSKELVAEAFADVMVNGRKASKLSQGVFDLLETAYKEQYG